MKHIASVLFIGFFVLVGSITQPQRSEAYTYCNEDGEDCYYIEDVQYPEPVETSYYADSYTYQNYNGTNTTSDYHVYCEDYDDDGVDCYHYVYEKDTQQQHIATTASSTTSPVTYSFPTYTQQAAPAQTYAAPTYPYYYYYPVQTPVYTAPATKTVYVPTPVTKTVTQKVYVPKPVTKTVVQKVYVPVPQKQQSASTAKPQQRVAQKQPQKTATTKQAMSKQSNGSAAGGVRTQKQQAQPGFVVTKVRGYN
jgi:hypothetical protein